MTEGTEMARELSTASRTAHVTLRDLDETLRGMAEKLEGASKSELAQIVGELDKLGSDVDAVVTADLESGKTSAKYYRKALVARVEGIRDHAAALYDDWELLNEETKDPPMNQDDQNNTIPINFHGDQIQGDDHEPSPEEKTPATEPEATEPDQENAPATERAELRAKLASLAKAKAMIAAEEDALLERVQIFRELQRRARLREAVKTRVCAPEIYVLQPQCNRFTDRYAPRRPCNAFVAPAFFF